MSQRNLAILLVLQLLLVAITWWPSSPAASRRAVFDVERDAIEQVEIALRPKSDRPEEAVVLVRDADAWKVQSAAAYPAAPAKVEALLDALLALEAGAAIAGHPSSHAPLNVGDETYGRRIAVTAGGEVFEWLVGAATNRSVNMRRVGQDDVYRADGASEWSFGELSANYFEKDYVDGDPASFAAVALRNANGDLRFEQADGVWNLVGLAEDETADSDSIAAFLDSVARVTMTEPVSSEWLPAHGLEDGARIDWTIAAEDQSIGGGYAVGAAIEGDRFVKQEGNAFVVRARESAVQPLLEARRSQFLQ